MKHLFLILILICSLSSNIFAQDDLMNLISNPDSSKSKTQYASATFKSTRIILGQSVENVAMGNLNFVLSHHFGTLNQGPYNFWGLDETTDRLGFEYGLTKRIQIGFGRSSYEKTYDGSLKIIIFKQCSGYNWFPLSLSYYVDATINSLNGLIPEGPNLFSNRLAFVHQLLIARKFTDAFSFQLTPTYIHYNLVPLNTDHNDMYSLGAGGRYKFTKRVSVNLEYYYLQPNRISGVHNNSFSAGFDIETGGHVFQLFISNSTTAFERAFIAETQGTWQKGDICFGFNIIRTFTCVKTKPEQRWQ